MSHGWAPLIAMPKRNATFTSRGFRLPLPPHGIKADAGGCLVARNAANVHGVLAVRRAGARSRDAWAYSAQRDRRPRSFPGYGRRSRIEVAIAVDIVVPVAAHDAAARHKPAGAIPGDRRLTEPQDGVGAALRRDAATIVRRH